MLFLHRAMATLMTAIAASSGSMMTGDGLNPSSPCSMAQFACRSESQCIALDQYCNGARECDDGSDEPPGCTRK